MKVCGLLKPHPFVLVEHFIQNHHPETIILLLQQLPPFWEGFSLHVGTQLWVCYHSNTRASGRLGADVG